jgi:arylsulfatase A-like enzyme
VLFLLADDMRYDTIAALGNPIIQTPALDRLVRHGMSFSRVYLQGGMHGATCMPSRAMLLSGRNLFHVDERLLREETWPAAFRKAGYSTFLTGKWHNGEAAIARSFQEARTVFLGGMTDPMKASLSELVNERMVPMASVQRHTCELFAEEAIRFLQRQQAAPFFAYVAFNAPHDPHIVPREFSVRYEPSQIPLPSNYLSQHPWNNGEMTVRDERLLAWPRTEKDVRALLADYYRYISFLDAQIDRVLGALHASKYASNTLVVFCADSGVARGSHGLIGKQNLYEHSARVPLIIAGPGIPKNRKTDALGYLFDVLPTLAELCGVPPPQPGEGISLAKAIRRPAEPGRKGLLLAYRDVQRAYVESRWKLIWYPQVNRTQLFDLKNDPMETVNLVDKQGHAQRLRELQRRLRVEMQRQGDSTSWDLVKPQSAEWSPPGTSRP